MAKKTITVASSASEKLKALQSAMSKIEKDFGKGSIMKMGDQQIEHVEVVPSGSIGLDYALGVGGYPRGRIIEIYGPESSGKTTLAIHAIAEERMSWSAISSACSPLSGCEMSRLSMSTPKSDA